MKQLKEILDIVSNLTEIPSNIIASQDKKEAVVFAKKLFVVATKKLGFPTSAISKTLNITPQAVRTDIQRAEFVKETLLDIDCCPEAVLECFTAKMCCMGVPIFWENYL